MKINYKWYPVDISGNYSGNYRYSVAFKRKRFSKSKRSQNGCVRTMRLYEMINMIGFRTELHAISKDSQETHKGIT